MHAAFQNRRGICGVEELMWVSDGALLFASDPDTQFTSPVISGLHELHSYPYNIVSGYDH
jgi:hypothetical protein